MARRSRHASWSAAWIPKQTLTRLADPVAVGPNLLWRAGNIRTPGTVAKVNLALAGLPRFTAASGEDGAALLRGRIVIAPAIDAMERAHDDAKFGRASADPIMEATIPSLADPSLVDGAPEGTHVMSVIVQSTPRTLRGHGLGRGARGRSVTGSSRRWMPMRRAWPTWSRHDRC